MKRYLCAMAVVLSVGGISQAEANDVEQGKALWSQPHLQKKLGKQVSCASCHTANLRQVGEHMRTGKHIEPMAVSVNPSRLSDPAKVAKWFRRNCKWTWGRECSATEQRHIMAWMRAN